MVVEPREGPCQPYLLLSRLYTRQNPTFNGLKPECSVLARMACDISHLQCPKCVADLLSSGWLCGDSSWCVVSLLRDKHHCLSGNVRYLLSGRLYYRTLLFQ